MENTVFLNSEVTETLHEKKYAFIEKPDTNLEENITTNPIDVAERVLYENQIGEQARIIEQQKKQLDAILENMTDGLFILNKNYKLELFNKGATNFFYDPDSIKKPGYPFEHTTYFDSQGNEILTENMPDQRVLRGEKINQFRITSKRLDKTVHLNICGSPVYDDSGNVFIAVLCCNDITEYVKYEEILKAQRDCLFTIIDTLDFPMIRLSYPDFNIIQINKKGYDFLDQILPGSKSELKSLSGTNSCTTLPYFEPILNYQSISEMVSIKNSIYLKNFMIILNNNERYMNLLYQPIFDLNEEIKEFLIISTDVTDEVIQKQKLEEIMKNHEEFFSYIAHEFKTPLTTISSTIQLMELIYNEEITENIQKNINTIRRSTYQQMRLVNNLLDITRAEAGYLKIYKKNFDIIAATKVITESIHQFAKAKDIKIKFTSSIKEKVIALDDEKYERILLNLLSNAIKFTPEGKSIGVTISSNNHKVFIKIKDEGVGIPKDKLEVIFERFGQTGSSFTRHSEGTGIGLCLVKLLIKAMGGDIKVDSIESKGSTFTVIFPDIKVSEDEEIIMPEFTDNRLVRALNTEFSDIYMV